jgi:hypothetical protein
VLSFSLFWEVGKHEEANYWGSVSCCFGFGLVPAEAATKYVAGQETLASFSSSAAGLTTLQRSQVEQAVESNAYAEKFSCTGIRYYEQAMSVNITVRKRAKAACDYAKELNPELST